MKLRIGFLGTMLAVALVGVCSTAWAGNRRGTADTAASEMVEFFSAMDAGEIDVKFYPKDSKGGKLLVTNKADKPLSIKMPRAFAVVPAQAQFGGGGMGGGGFGGGGMGGGGGSQGGGGGMDEGGFDDFEGGFFNVASEKMRKFDVNTVCLEHGKKEPNPRIAYKVIPIESFVENPAVIELCKMVALRRVPQNAAQAAAWHMTDGLSWAALAQKDRVRLSIGYREKYFSPREIQLAMRIVQESARRGNARRSNSDSLSDR